MQFSCVKLFPIQTNYYLVHHSWLLGHAMTYFYKHQDKNDNTKWLDFSSSRSQGISSFGLHIGL